MNRNLLFIALALLLWGFGEGMFFNFVPIYLDREFLLSKQQIGFALGVFAFSMMITHLPAGYMADRVGRRPLLVGAWVLGVVSTFVLAFSRSLPFYMVGLVGYGLTAFVSSPLSSYVTAARGKWPVATALSLTTFTFNTGMALGPWVGGQIGERFGMQSAYLVAGFVFAVSTVFIMLVQDQPLDHHDEANPPVRLWSNQRFVGFVGVVALAFFAMHLSQPLTPNYLESVRNLSLSETGLIFSLGALGNALMAVTFSRIHPRNGFLIAQATVILFALCIWLGTSLPVFALGYFLLGGFRASRAMFISQARELIPASQMGLAYGTLETVTSIITVITPIVAGYLFTPEPVRVYQIAIGLIVVSIVVSYLYSPPKVSHA